MNRTFALGAIFIVSCISLSEASALVRRIECREWVDKEYRGLYQFAFDDESGVLRASQEPNGIYPLFGKSVGTWKLIWKKDLHAVFYGVSEDWWAPVKVLSLNFGKPQMFPYGMGHDMEADTLVSKISRVCKRLD